MPRTRDEVRELDQRAIEDYGVPSVVLMENAGRGAAEVLLRLGVVGPVAILCGKGNNGGDGLVIARHLDHHGVLVRVLLFARPQDLAGDAAINFTIVERSKIPLIVHTGPEVDMAIMRRALVADWLVDALYGTGLTGAIRSPLDGVVDAINAASARVLAVDVPSGLDADIGLPLGPTVRADHTVTFVDEKRGFRHPEARRWLGQVHVVPIGAPRVLVESFERGQA